jgi:transcriptional regulator with XRE-family HTH domain
MTNSLETLSETTTSAVDLPAFFPPDAQRTMTIEERARDLTESAGSLRTRAAIASEDVADIHHRTFQVQLEARTANLVKRDPAELLDELAELGFAWRDIARMVGVTVPALRRWRNGEKPSGENRRAIAELLAFTQIIAENQVFEPASWMEVPITRGTPTTAIDLYARKHLELVFDLATSNMQPEVALDLAEPGWRERYASNWEVGIAEDNEPYLRPKGGR